MDTRDDAGLPARVGPEIVVRVIQQQVRRQRRTLCALVLLSALFLLRPSSAAPLTPIVDLCPFGVPD